MGSTVGKIADYTPIVSNVKGAVEGDYRQAIGGVVGAGMKDFEGATGVNLPGSDLKGMNLLGGLSPESLSRVREDANVARDMRDRLFGEYGAYRGQDSPYVGAATIDRTRLDPAAQATAANIDTAAQDQTRALQMGALAQTAAEASGALPTPEELMLRRQGARAAAQQAGMAIQAGRGGNMALAARTAANNTARIQADTAAQAAEQALRSRSAARQALIAGSGAARAQDLGLATDRANLQTDVSKFNAGQTNQVNTAQGQITSAESRDQAGLTQGAAVANQNASIQNRGQNIQERAGIRGDMLAAGSGALAGDKASLDAEANVIAAKTAMVGGAINGGAGVLTKLSDERQKKAVADGEPALRALLREVPGPKEFEYKNPALPGAGEGRQLGTMAQGVERAPGGEQLVADGPNGKELVSDPGFTLAALSMLEKRLSRMEARR